MEITGDLIKTLIGARIADYEVVEAKQDGPNHDALNLELEDGTVIRVASHAMGGMAIMVTKPLSS